MLLAIGDIYGGKPIKGFIAAYVEFFGETRYLFKYS